jgi:hypothetical protein
VILDSYWCRSHGRRATAALDPLGLLRCDAPSLHPLRSDTCDLLLEPVIVPVAGADEGGDDDETG